MKSPLSLYIHIPFCVRKCAYCDFLSFPADEQTKGRYLDALLKEITEFAPGVSDREVFSVFMGGGTPSLLSEDQILQIMETIHSAFRILPRAEITIEANPGTVTAEKLNSCKKAGINRISFGLQSADNKELELLGRIHSYEQFLESYSLARRAGFDNINVDVMSALPKQNFKSWQDTLQKVTALSPEHISAYSLIIEEGTPFYEKYHQEDMRRMQGGHTEILPDEDLEREIYEWTGQFLTENGYIHYEISNYAKPGKESMHNTGCWKRKDYAGFGLGAASLLDNCRYTNTSKMELYLSRGREAHHVQPLAKEECMEEHMYLGLRMMEGVSKESFQRAYGVSVAAVYKEVITQLKDQGLLMEDEKRLWLSKRGIDISNYCMAQFLL